MAQEYGIENPPNAGGGCLLTDPAFAIRAKDLFSHTDNPSTNDIDLLKIGRHFRLDNTTKVIVGRNQDENNMIKALALPNDIVFYAKDHVGPNTLLRGDDVENHKQITAAITLRYSDAPKETPGIVVAEKANTKSEISIKRAEESEYLQYRI
jgi:predicted ribosome quality control (RQC) complex YloA/Tae2 family protein